MRSEDIQEFVFRRPFVPFRITLNDGADYEVHCSEMVMIGRSSMMVGLPRPSGPSDIFDQAVPISLTQITRIEPLGASPSRESA